MPSGAQHSRLALRLSASTVSARSTSTGITNGGSLKNVGAQQQRLAQHPLCSAQTARSRFMVLNTLGSLASLAPLVTRLAQYHRRSVGMARSPITLLCCPDSLARSASRGSWLGSARDNRTTHHILLVIVAQSTLLGQQFVPLSQLSQGLIQRQCRFPRQPVMQLR